MVIDAETNETMEFYAKIVFVNGSTLGSTFILLNSTSEAHPNGLGNGSGQLGHNLMDHHFRCGAEGIKGVGIVEVCRGYHVYHAGGVRHACLSAYCSSE